MPTASYNQEYKGRQVPGAHQPATLAKPMSSMRFSERLTSKYKVEHTPVTKQKSSSNCTVLLAGQPSPPDQDILHRLLRKNCQQQPHSAVTWSTNPPASHASCAHCCNNSKSLWNNQPFSDWTWGLTSGPQLQMSWALRPCSSSAKWT